MFCLYHFVGMYISTIRFICDIQSMYQDTDGDQRYYVYFYVYQWMMSTLTVNIIYRDNDDGEGGKNIFMSLEMRSTSRNVEVTFVNDDRLSLSLKCSRRTDLLMVKHMFKTDFPPPFAEIRLNRKHAKHFLTSFTT